MFSSVSSTSCAHALLFCSGSITVVSSSTPPADSGRGSSVEGLLPAQAVSADRLELGLADF